MRRKHDYYPTPPCAVAALGRWLEPRWTDGLSWLEPAAGYGAIPLGLQREGLSRADQWTAYDIDERFRPGLSLVAGNVEIGDGLALPWSMHQTVVTNPPFSLLDDFAGRCVEHVEAGRGAAILLTRGQWFDEPGRRWLRESRLPTYELRLAWRLDFTGDSGGDFATYAWWLWEPGDRPSYTRKLWLEKPEIPDEWVASHRGFATMAKPRQRRLFG